MDALVHAIIFCTAIGIIWFFAGILVDGVGCIARRYCKSGFFMAFFILGFLTSISEFSVAANAVIEKVPGISAGNLIGASLVILLFIVPLLAAAGKGIHLNQAITKGVFGYILLVILLPALLVLDGSISRVEGAIALLAYGTMAYALYRKRVPIKACEPEFDNAFAQMKSTIKDVGRIVFATAIVFVAANFLVGEALYAASALNVPNSFVGLLLLSLGTNIPEIVIAFKSLTKNRADIAFGDYLGSAAMNTVIFGFLAIASGTFFVEASEFILTAIIFTFGIGLLYMFARSRLSISRKEGAILLGMYGAFVLLQIWNIMRVAGAH